jgi:hypothetical protein
MKVSDPAGCQTFPEFCHNKIEDRHERSEISVVVSSFDQMHDFLFLIGIEGKRAMRQARRCLRLTMSFTNLKLLNFERTAESMGG